MDYGITDSAKPPSHELTMERAAELASRLYDELVEKEFTDQTACDLTTAAMPSIIQAVLAR